MELAELVLVVLSFYWRILVRFLMRLVFLFLDLSGCLFSIV